jgi:hypothetical protein
MDLMKIGKRLARSVIELSRGLKAGVHENAKSRRVEGRARKRDGDYLLEIVLVITRKGAPPVVAGAFVA